MRLNSRFKPGDKVYIFDYDRRIYENGRCGPPIFREHFREVTINSETSRSLVVGTFRPKKYAKSGSEFYNLQDIEDACWEREHKYRIKELVGGISDVELLRKIADLIGYNPTNHQTERG